MNPQDPNQQPSNEPAPTTPPLQPQPIAPQPNPAPQPQYAQPIPGKTLGIVAFVLSLLGFGRISLILGIVAKSQSKKAGFKNGFALAAIIISAIGFVVIGGLIALTIALAAYNNVQAQARCNEQGPGTHVVNGITYVCDEDSKPVPTSVQ